MTAASPHTDPERGAEPDPLRAGDVVEVHLPNGPLIYRGEIDIIEVSLEVLWILHGALKERKLLLSSEYHIRRCPPEPPVVSPPA